MNPIGSLLRKLTALRRRFMWFLVMWYRPAIYEMKRHCSMAVAQYSSSIVAFQYWTALACMPQVPQAASPTLGALGGVIFPGSFPLSLR